MSSRADGPRRAAGFEATEPDAAPQGVSVIAFANLLLRHRVLIAVSALLWAVLAAALVLTKPRTFTATSVFVPQRPNQSLGISGIAAQFGFRIGNEEPAHSPAFYVHLGRSRPVLTEVVTTRYPAASGTTRNLIEHYEITEGTAAIRRDRAIQKLSSAMNMTEHRQTSLVQLTVRMTDPELARQVSSRILELLNTFNLENRQSEAMHEAQFTGTRLQEVGQDLHAAEEKVAAFLRSNREYRNSPTLAFAFDRLQRELATQQEVYTALAKAHEQAKIEQVRNTPVITVVAAPETAGRPDPRGVVGRTILGFLVGTLVGVVLAFWRRQTSLEQAANTAALREFQQLRREAWLDLTRPWRPIRRLFRPRAADSTVKTALN